MRLPLLLIALESLYVITVESPIGSDIVQRLKRLVGGNLLRFPFLDFLSKNRANHDIISI